MKNIFEETYNKLKKGIISEQELDKPFYNEADKVKADEFLKFGFKDENNGTYRREIVIPCSGESQLGTKLQLIGWYGAPSPYAMTGPAVGYHINAFIKSSDFSNIMSPVIIACETGADTMDDAMTAIKYEIEEWVKSFSSVKF